MVGHTAFSRNEDPSFHDPPELLNLLPMNRGVTKTDLKPIIFRRIMTPRDHNAATNRQREQRKVHQRRSTDADIDDIQPAGKQS